MPSAVVSAFFYDSVSSTLRVRYTSGIIYDYLNVPANVYEAMKNAFSKGKYLNEHIKGHYSFRRINENYNEDR